MSTDRFVWFVVVCDNVEVESFCGVCEQMRLGVFLLYCSMTLHGSPFSQACLFYFLERKKVAATALRTGVYAHRP